MGGCRRCEPALLCPLPPPRPPPWQASPLSPRPPRGKSKQRRGRHRGGRGRGHAGGGHDSSAQRVTVQLQQLLEVDPLDEEGEMRRREEQRAQQSRREVDLYLPYTTRLPQSQPLRFPRLWEYRTELLAVGIDPAAPPEVLITCSPCCTVPGTVRLAVCLTRCYS